MRNKYRIVVDAYAGFEVQIKRWRFPFWAQLDFTNTHSSLEGAKRYIKHHKGPDVVWEDTLDTLQNR